MYYQGSAVALIVFSLADAATFQATAAWVDELRDRADAMPKLFLVGNKADLADRRAVTLDAANAFADAIDGDYFETSARTGQNVRDLFDAVADYVGGRPAAPQPAAVLAERGRTPGCGCQL
jgi:GTPase SAR1 family protein